MVLKKSRKNIQKGSNKISKIVIPEKIVNGFGNPIKITDKIIEKKLKIIGSYYISVDEPGQKGLQLSKSVCRKVVCMIAIEPIRTPFSKTELYFCYLKTL